MTSKAAKTETPVIFRKWPEGDIIALFPTQLGTCDPYTCGSYEHVGQHGPADPVGVVRRTKPAKPGEYADLLAELESIGYDDLKVVQRLSPDYLSARKSQLSEMAGTVARTKATRASRQPRKKTPPGTSVQGLR